MPPLKRFFLTLALTAMWSPSFLFIKLAIQDLPPVTVAASRISLAAILLYIIVRWKGYHIPKNPLFWLRATTMSLFSIGIPFCLFCYAEKTIDSSLAAILNGTTPMFTVVLAQLFIPSDRLSISKTIGIALCAGGLFTLFYPNILQGMTGSTYGILAATLAAFCYSIGHVYGKKYFIGHPPFIAPLTTLLMSAVILWPFALSYEQPFTLPFPSTSSILGVCGLALFGTVFAFIIYYKLLEESSPIAISLVACFFPVGGMLLGVIFLGETFTITSLIASALILLGMMFVNQVISLRFLEPKSVDGSIGSYTTRE